MGKTHLLEPKTLRLLAEINLMDAQECPRILRLVILNVSEGSNAELDWIHHASHSG
jgi:hypothetical protein